MYSDAMTFDMMGKLKLDPLSFTLGRLPLSIRNKPLAWRYFGFIDNVKQSQTDTKLVTNSSQTCSMSQT